MAHCLIVGRGGFGDLFPLFAIAQQLQACGHTLTIAAESHHHDAVRSIGLALHATDQVRAGIPARPGVRTEFLRFLNPSSLQSEFEQTLAAAHGADIIIGNQAAYVGRMVSRVQRIPWVYCAASPLALPSPTQPPLFPYLFGLQRRLRTTNWAQRPFLPLAQDVTRLFMQENVAFQRRLGIWNGLHPRFEGLYSDQLNLLMVSPALMAKRPDWPARTTLAGFGWFEPRYMDDAAAQGHLDAFLQRGSAPVVIAPGGSTRTQPTAFFETALAAVKGAGRRAVVVAAKRFHGQLPQSDPDVLVCPYLPYSCLLHDACALIHSGGIGALGWAVRSGVPSLIVPKNWDHFDNAEIAEQANVARVVWRGGTEPQRVSAGLSELLADRAIHASLARIGPALLAEDGAKKAAQAITEHLLA